MIKTLCTFLGYLMLLATCQLASAAQSESYPSRSGHYQVSYTSELVPLAINQIHSWTLHVSDNAGNPVAGASIDVKGGMPAHNHGLATSPVVEEQGLGNYQLLGLRFHMMGYWELTLTISAAGVRDEVVIPLTL